MNGKVDILSKNLGYIRKTPNGNFKAKVCTNRSKIILH